MSDLTWLWGCLISLVGSVIGNVGTNTQKHGFLKNAQQPLDQRQPYIKLKLWWIGLVLVFISGVCDLVALSMAAQSIISPIGSITLVSNVFFASFWLKETVNWRDGAAMILIVIGSTLSVIFGDHEERKYDIDELEDLYASDVFIVYMTLIGALFLLGCLGIWYINPLCVALASALTELQRSMSLSDERSLYNSMDITRVSTAHANVQRLRTQYAPWKKIHPMLFCALSGICAAQSILLAKSVSELVSLAFSGDGADRTPLQKAEKFLAEFTSPVLYAFIIALGVCILGQLHFFALALDLFDSSYVQPTYKVFFLILSTIGGGCYFQEFGSFDLLQWIFFPFGIVLNLCGVYVLSYREMVRASIHLQQILEKESSAGAKEHALADSDESEANAAIERRIDVDAGADYQRLAGGHDESRAESAGQSSRNQLENMKTTRESIPLTEGNEPKTLSMSQAQLDFAIDGSADHKIEDEILAPRDHAALDEKLKAALPSAVIHPSELAGKNPFDSGRSEAEHLSYGSEEQYRATAPVRMKYSPSHPVLRLRAQQEQLHPAASLPVQRPTSVESHAAAAESADTPAHSADTAERTLRRSSCGQSDRPPSLPPRSLHLSSARKASSSGAYSGTQPLPPPPFMRRAASHDDMPQRASPLAKFMLPFAFSPSSSSNNLATARLSHAEDGAEQNGKEEMTASQPQQLQHFTANAAAPASSESRSAGRKERPGRVSSPAAGLVASCSGRLPPPSLTTPSLPSSFVDQHTDGSALSRAANNNEFPAAHTPQCLSFLSSSQSNHSIQQPLLRDFLPEQTSEHSPPST